MCRPRIVCLVYAEESWCREKTASTPRQVFGAMLRYYRVSPGLSRTELARQISKSVSLIQAIELGQRAATADVTEDLHRLRLWDGAWTSGSATRSATVSGHQVLPVLVRGVARQRARGEELRRFEPMLVPGPPQTAEYARAIFRARFGVDRRGDRRAGRGPAETAGGPGACKQPPALWVIVDEGGTAPSGRRTLCHA